MNIIVNEDLRAYIDPLTPEEHQALERSILAEGCRDALVLWGEILVDGHNRYGICRKHGLPFQTVQNTRFQSIEDVHLWMIDQHLGRRSVSDFQRGVLALRKKEIMAARIKEVVPVDSPAAAVPPPEKLNTRESIAKAARISSAAVLQIEKIQKSAAPELVEAVKQGAISINAAAVVATLPAEEQLAAVAGGKKELREAAKRVREEKKQSRPPRAEAVEAPAAMNDAAESAPADLIARLQQRVAELEAENAALRQQLAAATIAA
ncbi:plasmid replication/partition related protein [Roseateles violae]|uniref:Plasmid replication/partition related protein n=1 Tax=Roseateles violae TaxID=3058042 RepID=A0ABT8DUQ2_9BURK|nr:plasmid replication/partition related protein [Pelomonas sp. PFR6]MDN3922014.1 plasmid replication/partition related protein [Pelomonas sp. PFR6]